MQHIADRLRRRSLTARLATFAMMLMASLLGPLSAHTAHADDPNDYITISHTPPNGAIAGDGVPLTAVFQYNCGIWTDCTNAIQRLVYTRPDGTVGTIERTIANPETTGTDIWNVPLPGDSVAYPDVKYHFEVSVDAYEHWGERNAVYTDRSPVTGEHTIDVKNQVRFTVTNPDGSPAANVPIRYFVEDDSAPLSSLTTDVNGRVVWDVPMDLPSIAATRSTTGVAFIQMLIFTNFPTTALLGDGPRSGLALPLRLQINSGNALLAPVQVSVQDQVFSLQPDSIAFTANSAGFNSSAKRIGEKRGIKDYIGKNVGGAWHMWSDLKYTSSTSSESTFLTNTGNGWTSSEASTTSKSGQDFSAVNGQRGDAAPMCNYDDPQTDSYCMNSGLLIGWTYGLYDVWGCVPAGMFPYCYSYKQYLLDYPDASMTISEESEPTTVPSKHGKASSLEPNCYLRIAVPEFTSTSTRGQTYTSQFGFSGESLPKPVKLTVTFRRSATSGTSTGYTWGLKTDEDRAMGGDWFHFLWVEDGRASSPPKCPLDHPQKTWTHTSSADLSLL